jgi:hypothetical protein
MHKILTAGLAALTLGGSVLATAAPATAAPHGGGFHGGGFHGGFAGNGFRGGGFHGGFRGAGPFFAGSVIGLGLGAALAAPYYYGPGPYYSDYAYDSCYAPQRVWDPYAGHYVIERVPYAC